MFLSNALVFQLASLRAATDTSSSGADADRSHGPPTDHSAASWDRQNPLSIPKGQAQNLPSVRVEEEHVEDSRKIYGGSGDKKHLGGFTTIDLSGITPTAWSNIVEVYGVRSFIDIGCGRGISTRWFLEHGADVLCVEGSHDAVTKSFLPPDRIVEHDFSRGPWWPEKTYDMAWSVEFLEHVSRQYHFNYVSVFRKAALIFVTSSRHGGWHHVEVHPDDWWIRKFESYGFRYDKNITGQVKQWVSRERGNKTLTAPNGRNYGASHVGTSLKVFVNPMVAALPEHAHLFPRNGCFKGYAPPGSEFKSLTRPCGEGSSKAHLETKLPDEFVPLKLTPQMYENWHTAIKNGITDEHKVGSA